MILKLLDKEIIEVLSIYGFTSNYYSLLQLHLTITYILSNSHVFRMQPQSRANHYASYIVGFVQTRLSDLSSCRMGSPCPTIIDTENM